MKKIAIVVSSIVLGLGAISAHGMSGGMMNMNMDSHPKGAHSSSSPTHIKGWNNRKKIAVGKNLFAKNCAVCHGKNAQGQGRFPALNGKGHVAHHSPTKLLAQIENGGDGMPPFKNKLSKAERESIFVYLHSIWPKRVKHHYDKKFNIKG